MFSVNYELVNALFPFSFHTNYYCVSLSGNNNDVNNNNSTPCNIVIYITWY